MEKPELLAPAGNMEKLKTAIHYGADAVYLGISDFSLRARADNFGRDELNNAIMYARANGIKCYVTVNIFPHNRDIEKIKGHIHLLNNIKPDAVIVSDPGVFMLFREQAPGIPIHVSTQANITNYVSARFWERMGAVRLILARELNIDEIGEIRQKVDIELECFVHGALCISYSGRCYMSAFLANRSANSGECTNSCRWKYSLMEEKRPGEYFPVYETGRGTYVMSSRDLCMIRHLDKLRDAGVDSFKIEGRMKGINYIAGVVKSYREAIDELKEGDGYVVRKRWLDELKMFSSRGYTTGMYLGKQGDDDYNHDDDYVYRMSHALAGIILNKEGGKAKILMRNRLFLGEEIEFLTPGLEGMIFRIETIEDEEHMSVESARNDEVVWMTVPEQAREGDIIRKMIDLPCGETTGNLM
ncbi:putative protease YhbU precursor [bacterium BMS3Abin07]|nr:putative protease YhbU precursor [bacterium BMS3Abin07]GBE32000.1 putative protease YhbU precursor [bacterium BMS3Bbin05]